MEWVVAKNCTFLGDRESFRSSDTCDSNRLAHSQEALSLRVCAHEIFVFNASGGVQ